MGEWKLNMKTAVQMEPASGSAIEYQEASLDIWDKKYRLKAKNGQIIDETMDDTYRRVALALADVEAEEDREEWFEAFLWALRHGAIPADRSRGTGPGTVAHRWEAGIHRRAVVPHHSLP